MPLRHIVVCGPLCSIILHHLTKRIFFIKKVIEHKLCFDFTIKRFSETYFILRRTERDIKKLYWSSCKVPVYSCPSLRELEFS